MSRFNRLYFLPRLFFVFSAAGWSVPGMAQDTPVTPVPSVARPAPTPVRVPKAHPEVRALLERCIAAQMASPPRSEEALRFAGEAREKARLLGDTTGEATALYRMGSTYSATGHSRQSMESYRQVPLLYRQAGRKEDEANALYDIGNIYVDSGQFQKALEFTEQALALYRQAKSKVGQARALHNIGTVYSATGRPYKALESYQQSRSMRRQAGSTVGEAMTLIRIGTVYLDLGQFQNALEFMEQALALHRQTGSKVGQARTLTSISLIYSNFGQFQVALKFMEQALALYRLAKSKVGEVTTLHNIGLIYSNFGQLQKSLEIHQQALRLYRQMGAKAGEANTLVNIGDFYSAIGQPQNALESYLQALPLHRQVGSQGGEAMTLVDIGLMYSATGQFQKSLEFLEQALSLYRQAGSKVGQAKALTGIGLMYSATGQPQKALELLEQVLSLHRQTGSTVGQVKTLSEIALVQERRGRLASAERDLREAVALLETSRNALGGLSEAKVSFLTAKLDTYRRYNHLLLQRNKPAEAFAMVQKTKARALLDLMASGRVDISGQMTAGETQQVTDLRCRADQINAQMVQQGVQNEVGAKQRFAALKVQVTQAESDLQTFTDTLYARHPDLARKRAAKTATLADVAGFLPPDTALLEYVVLDSGSGTDAIDETVLFVVTNTAGKAQVRTYALPVRGDALQTRTLALRLACADPRKPFRVQAQAMQRLLLPPDAMRGLGGKKRLVICPDGALWDVPFAALCDKRGRFLLERFELAFAYSATGAQATLLLEAKKKRRIPAAGVMLALANPDFGGETRFSVGSRFGDNPAVPGQRPIDAPSRPIDAPSRPIDAPSRPIDAPSRDLMVPRGARIAGLPGTQREADMLRKRFPRGAVILTQGQAQEERVKADAGRYRYVHLASHAFFNDSAPLLSSIVLAQPPPGSAEDGFLTAREIFALNLSGTDMVVLSACNTARGEKRSGEGIIGLTWALFVAGVPTQVLTQWAVDDASTATLMGSFYSGLTQRDGKEKTKGDALRSAALSLRRNRKYSHPYYWAPFVLMGDWRK